jgi:hypothetical protein
VADAVADAEMDAATVAVPVEGLTGINPTPLDTTHQLIGVNSLLKSAIKSAKTVTRKANLAGLTSALLVTFLLSKSLPLSAPSSSKKLQQTQRNQPLLKPPTTKLATLLAGKKAPRNSMQAANDSRWALQAPCPIYVLVSLVLVCLQPIIPLLVILFLLCFSLLCHHLCHLLILFLVVVNLILMPTPVHLALILYPFLTRRVCDVSPYNTNQGECKHNVPIISGVTAYTCQNSGQIFILVSNEGLWFDHKLPHSLLNHQNQIRYNGISVWDNPFDHSNPLSIEHPDVIIPLLTSGTNIFLNTCTPTQHELDSCPHIHLTCNSKWNPQTVNLASISSVEAEGSITGDGNDNGIEQGLSQISCVHSYTMMPESLHNIYDPNSERSISATMTDVPGHRMFISKD